MVYLRIGVNIVALKCIIYVPERKYNPFKHFEKSLHPYSLVNKSHAFGGGIRPNPETLISDLTNVLPVHVFAAVAFGDLAYAFIARTLVSIALSG